MAKEYIKINLKRQHIAAKLRTFSFQEGNTHIVYLPSVEISGYGDTIEEAHDLAKITLNDFSQNLFKLPESKIYAVLRELGWERDRFFQKKMNNLSNITYEDIKKEFNIPDNTPIRETSISV